MDIFTEETKKHKESFGYILGQIMVILFIGVPLIMAFDAFDRKDPVALLPAFSIGLLYLIFASIKREKNSLRISDNEIELRSKSKKKITVSLKKNHYAKLYIDYTLHFYDEEVNETKILDLKSYTGNDIQEVLNILSRKGLIVMIDPKLKDFGFSGSESNNVINELIVAARDGEDKKIKQLVNLGIDVNAINEGGYIALLPASLNGHVSAVRELIASGAKVDITCKNLTPLMAASAEGHFEVVRELVGAGANIDMQCDNKTALMIAASNGYVKIMQELINAGADINLQNEDGSTALMFAAAGNKPDAVKLLVDLGAFTDLRFKNKWTALMLAEEGKYEKVIQILSNASKCDNFQGIETKLKRHRKNKTKHRRILEL